MATNIEIEAAKKVLLEVTNDSPLKGKYHGMSAYEIAKMMLDAAKDAEVTAWAELEAAKGNPDFIQPKEAVV